MLGKILLLMAFKGVPRLVIKLLFDRRVPLILKFIIPAAIIYFIFPADIIPDILPILGRIDDIAVLLISVVLFLGLASNAIFRAHIENANKKDSKTKTDSDVIDGEGRIVDDEEKFSE